MQVLGIDQRMPADVTVGFLINGDLSAGGTDPFFGIGMLISGGDGIGKPMQLDDLGSLVIVKIKAQLLLKMNAAFFAPAVLLNLQSRVQTKIVVGGIVESGVTGCLIGLGKPRTGNDSAIGTVGKERPQPKEHKAQNCRCQHPKKKLPPLHSPLGRIGLMVLIIRIGAKVPNCQPNGVKEELAQILEQNVPPQVFVLGWDFCHVFCLLSGFSPLFYHNQAEKSTQNEKIIL